MCSYFVYKIKNQISEIHCSHKKEIQILKVKVKKKVSWQYCQNTDISELRKLDACWELSGLWRELSNSLERKWDQAHVLMIK